MTKAQFIKILKNYIASEQDFVNEHEKVKAILLPLVGKDINGKVLNAKVLNGYKFKPEFSMYHIEGKYSHLIGYQSSENTIQVEPTENNRGFNYFDGCHGHAAIARIKTVEAVLNDTTKLNDAYKAFNAVDKAYNALKSAVIYLEDAKLDSYHFAPHYEILSTLQPSDKERKDLNLHTLKYYPVGK
jgi:hypothetical protein